MDETIRKTGFVGLSAGRSSKLLRANNALDEYPWKYSRAEVTIYRIKAAGKCGYISSSGKPQVAPKYSDCSVVSCEGIAIVKVGNKFGYIDLNGKEIISPKYADAGYFQEGLAAVSDGKKWGFINTVGKLLIPFEYDLVASFSEGRAAAFNTHPSRQLIARYIDKNGKAVTDTLYSQAWQFSCGRAWVNNYINGNNSGYIDLNGKLVTRYEGKSYSENLASVWRSPSGFSLIDVDGTEVLSVDPAKSLSQFSEGFAVYEKSKFGFVDIAGTAAFSKTFTQASPFFEGLAMVQDGQVSKVGFIDKTGEFAFPANYDAISRFWNGLSFVRADGFFGWIDSRGNWVWRSK